MQPRISQIGRTHVTAQPNWRWPCLSLSFSHRTSIVQKIGDPRKKVLIINFVAKSIPNNGQIVAREPRTRRVVVV